MFVSHALFSSAVQFREEPAKTYLCSILDVGGLHPRTPGEETPRPDEFHPRTTGEGSARPGEARPRAFEESHPQSPETFCPRETEEGSS